MSTWQSKSLKADKDLQVGIVVAEFNAEYTEKLLANCQEELGLCGVSKIIVQYVPGSFELPFVAAKLQKQVDVVICLGVIIRGDTVHFELVANETARGIMQLNLSGSVPVIFGVLACENSKQVEARLVLGKELARAAIKMSKQW